MPLSVTAGAPTVAVRREAYERSGLTRAEIDASFALTDEEFRVEGALVLIGPIYEGEGAALTDFIDELEKKGLIYFDDFFELSGNWPDWLRLLAAAR